MIIGIDIRCLEEGRKTGVEEYTLNLLKNIFELDKDNTYVLFLNSFRKSKSEIDWVKNFPNVKIKKFNYPNKILNLLFWYFGWPKIDKLLGGVDVFFMPNINFGSFSKNTILFLTIHDLSFEHMPETFSWKRQLWHFFINPKKICQRADKIIAVSDSTKSDLVNFYHIDSEKINVVPSAASDAYRVIDRNDPKFLEIKEKYKLPYYFILYLGTMEPRKNIIGIIKAYRQLLRLKNPEFDKYKLIIAGAQGWKERKIIKNIGDSDIEKNISSIGFISPEDKPYLYNLATILVYPSFFEGFGFPPLEAMSCGVPVIASNNSSLPEIVGDSGIMIDPDNPDEISKAMREILLNKNLKGKLRDKGLQRAKMFSWKKTAREFLELIKK